MRARWRTNDGAEFEAGTPEEVIHCLHTLSLVQEETDEEWMQQASHRSIEQGTGPLDTTSPGTFVTDLLAVGLIRIVK